MAVFGFNLTVSILGLFFLRKLVPAFDLPSKLLTGFYRFFAPSENECRQAAQLKPKTVKGSKKNQNVQSKEFVIPKVWINFYFIFSNIFYSGCWSASLLCTSETWRLELSSFLPRVLLACRVLNYHAFCSGCHWSRSKVPFCLYRFNWRLDVANSNGEVTQFQMNSICPSSGSSLLACFAQLTWRVYPRSWLEAPESAAWSVTLSKCQN